MVYERQNRFDRRQFLVVMGAAATCGMVLTSGLAAEPTGKKGNQATINNVQPRRDVEGKIIDAHDGCLERFGDRFYLYGTAYGKTDGFGTANRFVVYSSPDLVQWTLHGDLVNGLHHGVHYRPYVKYNPKSKKYVLWYNWYPTLWNGQYAVAVADKPQGPFTIHDPNVKVKKPNPGDLGLFVDDDGTGYLVHTAGLGGNFGVKVEPIPHHQICVEKLTADFLGTTQETSAFVAGNCESPAMFKRNGIYYLLFDNTCCFCPEGSGARVYTASAPMGPFTYRGNINIKADHSRDLPSPWTPPGSGRPDCIIKAQQTHVATLPTPSGVVYLWMGDRWGSRPDGIKGHDFQYWSSPLHFDDDGMIQQLKWEDQWRFELQP